MSGKNTDTRRLQWEIASVIVLKIVLLVLIWQFFFSANRVDVDAQKMDAQILSAPQGEHEQAR